MLFHAIFLGLLPIACWLGMRGLGFRRVACTFGALCIPFLGSRLDNPLLKGLQMSMFIWSGQEGGQYSRLVGSVFGLLALGSAGSYIRGHRSVSLGALLLTFAWWSHFGVAYGVSMLLMALAVASANIEALFRWVKVHVIVLVSLLYVCSFV